MTEKVLVTLDNGLKQITINRPERRNSVDPDTLRALLTAFTESASDGTRVIVFTGAGESFCAGADLVSTNERDIASYDVTAAIRERVNPMIQAMRTLPIPIIGRVHGPAVGIGCNYALACDLLIASEEASFGQVFIKIGLMPDGGSTYFLPRLVGYQKSFELMALGEIISAAEALRLNLVNRVVPFTELDSVVDKYAAKLLAAPQVALAKIKAGLNHAIQSDLNAALEFEAVNQNDCFHSADFLEGVTAFVEKRKAVFGKSA